MGFLNFLYGGTLTALFGLLNEAPPEKSPVVKAPPALSPYARRTPVITPRRLPRPRPASSFGYRPDQAAIPTQPLPVKRPPQPAAELIDIDPEGPITNGDANHSCWGDVRDGNLEKALETGDVRNIRSEKSVLKDLLITAECQRTQFNEARIKLFNLNEDGTAKADSLTAISWNPSHDAALLRAVFGESESILRSNSTWRSDGRIDNESLTVIGQSGDTRHIVFGSHPMRNIARNTNAANEDMQALMRNSLEWLTGRDDLDTQPFNIVIAQMAQSYYFPDRSATRSWLDANYANTVTYNDAQACDDSAMIACLNDGADLLIISQHPHEQTDIADAVAGVEHALAAGIPVMYVSYDGGLYPLGKAILPLLKTQYYADNYWPRQGIENFNPVADFRQLPTEILEQVDLIKRFLEFNFTINFSQCEDNDCPENSGFESQFLTAAQNSKDTIDAFDRAGVNLFEQSGQRFTKGLVLLADHFRQKARFPMDKTTTPQRDFLSSLYADMVVHTARDVNPVQADMGNFSRYDFSHITPVTKDITLTAREYYKAAGVYALPGQTVTVTRNDNTPVNTHIKVNMVRSGSTHLFDNNTYNRPKYTQSQDLPIAQGETVKFTSPYGGPIQIRFDAKDMDVSFTFQNVGEHAVWRGAEDNLDFATKLDAGDYDWAELITPSFQVHSKLDKMRETVANPMWGSAAAVGAATEAHLHNYPHVLAGFKGVGIDVVPEIHDFATDNGLEIHTLDTVKHMNADQASCGYGCSGNPYDAYWAFDPIGHGDIHELGHGLERSRFRYSGQVGHTSTNPYSYYSKWKKRANDATAIANLGCQSLPYETLFNTVQASRGASDPAQYMRDQGLTNWNYGAGINHQIMMAAQDLGLLEDGRHLLARLHIIEREFNIADNSDSAWAAKRVGLGFGSFTRAEARALSNNDWNLIALSHALERNMTDYLELWGFELTAAAKAHVSGWNYAMMPTDFYTVPATQHCDSFEDLPKLAIDGKAQWPVASQKPLSFAQRPYASDHVCTHDDGY